MHLQKSNKQGANSRIANKKVPIMMSCVIEKQKLFCFSFMFDANGNFAVPQFFCTHIYISYLRKLIILSSTVFLFHPKNSIFCAYLSYCHFFLRRKLFFLLSLFSHWNSIWLIVKDTHIQQQEKKNTQLTRARRKNLIHFSYICKSHLQISYENTQKEFYGCIWRKEYEREKNSFILSSIIDINDF